MDMWTATVDYGDGSGIQPLTLNEDKTFTLSHEYPLEPTGLLNEAHPYSCNYPVVINITDDKTGIGIAEISVTWHNFVPQVEGGQHKIIKAGREFTGTAGWIDPGLNDQISISVNWGDGASEQLPDDEVYFDRDSKSIYLNHTYENAGTYLLTVSVTDNFGDTGSNSIQIEVRSTEPPGKNK
jgi:hypothetical protein